MIEREHKRKQPSLSKADLLVFRTFAFLACSCEDIITFLVFRNKQLAVSSWQDSKLDNAAAVADDDDDWLINLISI